MKHPYAIIVLSCFEIIADGRLLRENFMTAGTVGFLEDWLDWIEMDAEGISLQSPPDVPIVI